MAWIEIRGLYKIFGPHPKEALSLLRKGHDKNEILDKSAHTVALQNIDLDIEKGETFVVMGLSGSGKSTLVRCLNRLIEPTYGQIRVDGDDVLKYSHEQLRQFRRSKMTMVFQRFGLMPHHNVRENVAFGLEIRGVGKAEREQKALNWIETVGLKGWEESQISELSGGMQQRVGLARALCNDPEVLLMDEPFSALDPLIRREMQHELIDLQGRLNKTIIFITHDLDEALRLGDRIAILKDGRLVQVGTPEEILENPADDYVKDFTRDVNRSRVLTASSAMIEPYSVVKGRSGPRVALEMMRKDNHSSIFVTDYQNRLQGLVTVDDVIEATRKGTKQLLDVELKEVHTCTPESTLDELIPLLAGMKWPVAVVDENNTLLGIVPRVAILTALSGDENSEEATNNGNSNEGNTLQQPEVAWIE
jgi:glycine betaine/proline transport system ATP-binding protein